MVDWNEEIDWVVPYKHVSTNIMKVGDFCAKLKFAPRLVGDIVHPLPQGRSATVFPVATLPGCPDGWIKESGSYIVPVETEIGIWFDWRTDNIGRDWNTAVIPSVKGMNPITGMSLDGFQMHSYIDKCPIHDEYFAHGRICEKCGYEWPSQNYVTKDGELWWDGYRIPEDGGSVRQFFFTDEDKRDVASAVIGKENTVPAFGFAFYKTKVSREPILTTSRGYVYSSPAVHQWGDSETMLYGDSGGLMGHCDDYVVLDSGMEVEEKTCGGIIEPQGITRSFFSTTEGVVKGPSSFCHNKIKVTSKPKKSKSVSVGAGATIDQELAMDDLGLDGWQDDHSGVIRLYFCFEEEFKEIIKKGGVKELKSNAEGYLKDLPVG